MTELDSATHSNSVVATETSTYSADSNSQTEDLNNYVKDLENILFGEKTTKHKESVGNHTRPVKVTKHLNTTLDENKNDDDIEKATLWFK